jgi:hypothetical protein
MLYRRFGGMITLMGGTIFSIGDLEAAPQIEISFTTAGLQKDFLVFSRKSYQFLLLGGEVSGGQRLACGRWLLANVLLWKWPLYEGRWA